MLALLMLALQYRQCYIALVIHPFFNYSLDKYFIKYLTVQYCFYP